jgi:hypothetical protein
LQKLSGICRETLDIATLPFGVQGIKGERGLARTGQSRDDHELVSGEIQRHVFEIVGAGTPNSDFVHDTFLKANLVLYRAGATIAA